ncbi:maleylpyruvate isomerase family mycothiol-dependent enzyme [Microlunatus speluncae]|uniref:maleylpyruvate isomerase family mycothiol-dependent enzyme n=1 Tax=Microlunatus speluncae TaxID=2594267 RepID=UPI0012660A83|nr:maleylpyruvate isomerase family mycothiol-dependent enzyme [Microlunatus speluncae]
MDADVGVRLDARPLFRRTRAALLELLADLSPADWQAPTVAAPWLVRDLVAHLLGDDVSRLSRSRDDHDGPGPAAGETLPVFLARINDEWVRAVAAVSPAVLRDLLGTTSDLVHAYWQACDLAALGEPVSWAGPDPAPVWLDCARDFTEDWVHQQQIRDAVGRPGLEDAEALHAVIDTFLHAMPLTLRQHAGPVAEGAAVTVRVGELGSWTWRRTPAGWDPDDTPADPALTGAAVIDTDPDTWWRLCVRMLEPDQARELITVTGDEPLATAATHILSIIR